MLIPSGSPVRGRVRRLEWNEDKGGYFVVGLEFTEIEAAGTRYRFFADLDGDGCTARSPPNHPDASAAGEVPAARRRRYGSCLRRYPVSLRPAGRGRLLRASPPPRYPARIPNDLEDARAGTLKVPMVCFTCNICGADNEVERFASEPATCACGSNVRLRALIHLLSIGVVWTQPSAARFSETEGDPRPGDERQGVLQRAAGREVRLHQHLLRSRAATGLHRVSSRACGAVRFHFVRRRAGAHCAAGGAGPGRSAAHAEAARLSRRHRVLQPRGSFARTFSRAPRIPYRAAGRFQCADQSP